MIFDKEAELVSATAFDLETVRPGPGKPIKMYFLPSGGTSPLVITDGPTNAAADALMSVEYTVGEGLEFHLPASTARWIKATFTGDLGVVMDGQTNK